MVQYYNEPYNVKVSDPTDAVREGDVITMVSGWRVSTSCRHVVTNIVAPFGDPLHKRPALLSEEERLAIRAERNRKKDERKAARGRPVSLARVNERRLAEGLEALDLKGEKVGRRVQRWEVVGGKDAPKEVDEATEALRDADRKQTLANEQAIKSILKAKELRKVAERKRLQEKEMDVESGEKGVNYVDEHPRTGNEKGMA